MAVTEFERETNRALWRYWAMARPHKTWARIDQFKMLGVKYDPKLRQLIKWRLGDPRIKQVK